MSIPPFIQGYPQDGSSLGSSKSVIRANLDGEFQVFSVDHYNQNGTTPGFHQQSTYPNVGFAPTTVSGQLALYSKSIGSGKSALFMIRDGSAPTETQLTNPNIVAPVATQNGYTFLPGGLIMQWGLKTGAINNSVGGPFTANMPIAFPSAGYIVECTPICINSPTTDRATVAFIAFNSSRNAFTYNAIAGSSGNYSGFFWVAIGK